MSFRCVDGHAQERSLFDEVLKTVNKGELWIGDRCMCTLKFLFGVHEHQANFVIREHKTMPWEAGIPAGAADSCASKKTYP